MGENIKSASWKKMEQRSREIWKDLGGGQEEVLSVDNFGGYKAQAK